MHCASIAWMSFIVLPTYHLLYCPLIPRAPSLVLPGDWIYPQITRELVPRHYQIEDISDNQLILNICITFTTMIMNDLNSQHITNHQLGFKLFTVHSSPAQRLPILNQLKLIIKRYKSSPSYKTLKLII